MQRSSTKYYERGQVASFFVLSFAFFMVLLMMIINAGILTRDRIKIQNTVDLAALVGANIQRFNLNRIAELNDAIEDAYEFTRLTLANPLLSAPCVRNATTCGQAFCALECNALQKLYSQNLIQAYLSYQALVTDEIMKIIAEANGNAFDFVKRTALAGPNLPVDVSREILNNYGGNFPSEKTMVEEYDRGGLVFDYGVDGASESMRDIYQIFASEDQPLFIPEVEEKTIVSFTGIYGLKCGYGTINFCSACLCDSGKPNVIPIPQKVPVRVEDTGEMTPALITSISYSPQFDFNLFKFPVKKLNPNPFAKPELIASPGSTEPILLFDALLGTNVFPGAEDQRRFMSAWAASRPFGGSPGKDEYTGAKLIGLGSKVIGEVVQDFGAFLEGFSADLQESYTITERDFLH